jgi:hypothetical protein
VKNVPTSKGPIFPSVIEVVGGSHYTHVVCSICGFESKNNYRVNWGIMTRHMEEKHPEVMREVNKQKEQYDRELSAFMDRLILKYPLSQNTEGDYFNSLHVFKKMRICSDCHAPFSGDAEYRSHITNRYRGDRCFPERKDEHEKEIKELLQEAEKARREDKKILDSTHKNSEITNNELSETKN